MNITYTLEKCRRGGGGCLCRFFFPRSSPLYVLLGWGEGVRGAVCSTVAILTLTI